MRKEKRLFGLMGMAADEYVLEAENGIQKKSVFEGRHVFYLWAAAAATLVLLIGTIGFALGSIRPGNGETGHGNDTASGSGRMENGSEFMSYAGPIFPLTISGQEELSATRKLTYCLETGNPKNSFRHMRVTDTYVISNHTDADVTITAYYPYEGNLRDYAKLQLQPSLFADGQKQNTETVVGAYAGGLAGVWAGELEDRRISASEILSWEDYRELLSDGKYLQQALEEPGELAQPVTVYEFSDFEAPLEQYDAATQAISFIIDSDTTQIMSYGFNGMSRDDETGFCCYDYFVPHFGSAAGQKKALLVFGEDIGEYKLTGYKTGACEEGNELDEVSCTVVRRETTFGQILQELTANYLENCTYLYGDRETITGSQYTLCETAVKKAMNICMEAFSRKHYECDFMMLEDWMSEALNLDCILYESFPLTIPAGGTVTVTAELEKEPSFDYDCSGSQNVGIEGYDMVTKLGSDLEFQQITANLENMDGVQIIRQNFGFDLEQGITEVELDVEQEHYYMEIRIPK